MRSVMYMERATRTSHCWCLLLSLLIYGSHSQDHNPVYHHTVYLNSEYQNASDTANCGTNETHPCNSLSYVLQHRLLDATQVIINSGGNYSLNESLRINNKSLLSIATSGNGSLDQDRVTVTCAVSAGLSFVECSNVTLYGLEFFRCSALQESTSRNFSSPPPEFSFMKFPVSLYFLSCQNISLVSIAVSESRGTGVAVYATGGHNYFHECTLAHNGSPDNNTYPSGGGMYIEFPFCSPLDPPEQCLSENETSSEDYVITSAVYEIAQSRFQNNTAHMWHPVNFQYLLPEPTNHLSFGSGGGLSVYFSRVRDSVVRVTECVFKNNRAEWGGGAAVEFQGMSWNNSLVMDSCTVQNNTALSSNVSQAKDRGGGGLKLIYTTLNSLTMAHNNMTFINCTFENNTAYWGGGILLRAVRERQATPTNTLTFQNCSWISNLGRVGSAMDLDIWGPVIPGALLKTRLVDCIFRGNNDIFLYLSPLGQPISVGSLYTRSIPLLFQNLVLFHGNNHSALTAVNTLVDFDQNCSAVFTNNVARNGGAIALLGSAFLRVNNKTQMMFSGNTATKFGGAIYHSALGQHELYLFGFCFIQYVDIITPPWNWTSTFHFKNNTAKFRGGGNSIYATSLVPCFWSYALPDSHEVIPYPNERVFCWNNSTWFYNDSNCTTEISSAPAEFNNSRYHMQLVPGKREVMPLKIWGDKRKNQTENAIFNLWSHNLNVQIAPGYTYVSDNAISIHGTTETNATVGIETIDPRVVYAEIAVEVLPCPPGFVTHSTKTSLQRCVCNNQFGSVLRCSQGSFRAQLRRGLWMGKDPVLDKVVVGIYPYTKADSNETYIELASNMSGLDELLCGHSHRKGPFCAICKDGYGPSINSLFPKCVKCKHSKSSYYWVFYILVAVVPVTIFFFVIMLFHISVTRGALNSFVLFAQLITTTFDITGDGTIPLYSSNSQKAYQVLYNFWNLDFFISVSHEFCLSPKLNTMTVLSFHYFLAFYSLALIIVFYWLVRLYEYGVQPFFLLGKPIHSMLRFFRQRWNLNRSIVDAFSTFLVLSSTKFTVVSVYLLTPVTYIHSNRTSIGRVLYFQGDLEYLSARHAPYLVLAVVVLTTCVLLPTLLLLVYPLRLVKRVGERLGCCGGVLSPGSRIHLFLDTFQGCFKDGTKGTRDCRYFAGVYFILRAVFFTSYAYSGIWLQQYLIQQLVCTVVMIVFSIVRPYKKTFYNNLDITMWGILAMINALSMYNVYNATQGFALSRWAFVLQYMLIYCPLIYLIGYIIWKMLGHRKRFIMQLVAKCSRSERQALLSNVLSKESEPSIDDEYRQFADNVEAFGRDREINNYRPITTDTSGSEESGQNTTTARDSLSHYRGGDSSSGVSTGPPQSSNTVEST